MRCEDEGLLRGKGFFEGGRGAQYWREGFLPFLLLVLMKDRVVYHVYAYDEAEEEAE